MSFSNINPPIKPNKSWNLGGRQDDADGQYWVDGVIGGSSNKLAIIGDSILSKSKRSDVAGTEIYTQYNESIIHWAAALAGVDITNDVVEAAVPGYTSAKALDLLLPTVLASDATVCVVLIGANDFASVNSSETIKNIKSIVDKLSDHRIWPILIGPFPRITMLTTTAQAFKILEVNNYFKEYFNGLNFGNFVDAYGILVNEAYTNTTPPIIPGFTLNASYDTVHQANYGAYLVGKLLAPIFAELFPPIILPISMADAYEFNVNSKVLNNNPLFIGSGGAVGANCTGIVPRGWTTSADVVTPAVFSVSKANGGVGNKVVIQINATGAGHVFLQQTGLTTDRAGIADLIHAVAKMRIVSADGLRDPRLYWGDGVKNTTMFVSGDISTPLTLMPANTDITLKTNPRQTQPGAGSYRIYLRFAMHGAGTAIVEIEQAGLIKA